MQEIKYLVGDASEPQTKGNTIIAHACNDFGKWGKGFVLNISKRWTEPLEEYNNWHQFCHQVGGLLPLGEIQMVKVEDRLWVCNLIGQHKIWWENGVPPIRYEALEEGLIKLADEARRLDATVVCPKIGCGLAGGKWKIIEQIIQKTLCSVNVPVIVYLPPQDARFRKMPCPAEAEKFLAVESATYQ